MSKRVRFTRDHDHHVRAFTVVAYKAGQELPVPDDHADAALKAGAAVLAEKPASVVEAVKPADGKA